MSMMNKIIISFSIFSSLFFENDPNQTRVAEEKFFVLDLFFSNKLFRKEHLLGIHFNFTDNPVSDMYNLYLHSRFRKISHRGSYLPYTEEEAIEYVKSMQTSMFRESKKVFSKGFFYDIIYRMKDLCERIGKLLAAEQVEMQVLNRLAAVLAAVGDHAIAVGQSLCLCDLGNCLEDCRNGGAVGGVYLIGGGEMELGHDQNVNGCHGIDIAERVNQFVFIHL